LLYSIHLFPILTNRGRARTDLSNTARPRPIDLDYLATRLGEISAERRASPRPSSTTSSTTGGEFDDHHIFQSQTWYYNSLISEGGRPSHPISLGRDAAKNPGEYREILSFWQTHEDDWMVFNIQLGEWRLFRDEQCGMRRQDRFSAYHQGVQDRLRKHGFERLFRLDERWDRQDKLTTWIEFMNYEYRKYEEDKYTVERLQPQFDRACEALTKSKILESFDKEGYLRGPSYQIRGKSEITQGEDAVKSAELVVRSAEEMVRKACSNVRSARAFDTKMQKLTSARSKLAVSKKKLRKLKKTLMDFYLQTDRYKHAKKHVERRGILLRWILQQVPLIELESSAAMVVQNGSSGKAGGNEQCLKRKCADLVNEGGVSKRRREDSGDDALPNITYSANAPATCPDVSSIPQPWQTAEGEGQLKRNRHDEADEGQPTKRPRHNGRNRRFSSRKSADIADQTFSKEPLSVKPLTSQGFEAPTTRRTRARFASHPVPTVAKPRSQPKKLDKGLLDEKPQPPNRGKGGEIFSHVSAVDSFPPRRSARIRRPPNRLY